MIYSHLRILVQTYIQENIGVSLFKSGLGTGGFTEWSGVEWREKGQRIEKAKKQTKIARQM